MCIFPKGPDIIHVLCALSNIQVSEIGVEYYTGVGKPPYCEMTLRADHKCSRPLDLTLPVTLTGVKQPTTIILKREAQQGIWKEASSSEHETGKLCSFNKIHVLHMLLILL